MTRVDWAYLCDLAYFDSQQQLCLLGLDTTGPVRTLRPGTYRFTIVAHVVDAVDAGAHGIAVSVATPDGTRPLGAPSGCHPERRGEFLLIPISSTPFWDEGVYRFEVVFDRAPAFDIPLVISSAQSSLRTNTRLPS